MTRMRGMITAACVLLAASVLGSAPAMALGQTAEAPPAPVAYKPPVLAKVSIYQDWVVACDNSLACEASSLMTENGDAPETRMILGFTISAPPNAQASMTMMLDDKPAAFPLLLKVAGSDVLVHRFADAASLEQSFALDGKAMRALSTGSQLVLSSESEAPLAMVSLRGFRDVLLNAQTAQKGKADVRSVTLLPARNIPRSPPMEPTPKEIAALRKESGCTVEKGEWQDRIFAALDRTTTLILLSCGAGAYNFSYVPYVGRIEQGRKRFTLAAFDYRPDWGEAEGAPMLVNPVWDGAKSRLTSFAKARGLGDCGSSEEWVWTGGRFTLVLAQAMPECRGSPIWPTLFRAEVRPSASDVAPVVVPVPGPKT